MSDTLNAKSAITRPRSVKEKKNDIDCKQYEADYTRTNLFKWFLLILLMIICLCITGLFLYKLFTDSKVQNFILNQIQNNIVFIIVTIFAILKINLPKKN